MLSTTSSYNARYTFSGKEKDSETGYSYFGARYYSSDLSIWLSVDPMSDKYPGMSPYSYCAGNPVRLVDLNGEEVIITGDAADDAVGQLQNKTNLTLSLGADGKLSYTGKARTRIDRMIKRAIDSKTTTTNIIANNSNKGFRSVDGEAYAYEQDDNGIRTGGAYGGSKYSNNYAYSYQYVAPNLLAAMDKRVGDAESGGYMLHEFAEGYKSAIMAYGRKTGDAVGGVRYEKAHNYANRYSGGGYVTILHNRYKYELVKLGAVHLILKTGIEKNYKITYERNP